MTISTVDELTMRDAVHRQGVTVPGGQPPGTVLVAAIVPHKHGPPNKGPDHRVRYLPGQHYWMDEQAAIAAERRGVVYRIGSKLVDWYSAKGRVLSPWGEDKENPAYTEEPPGALKIIQGCGYDPGSAAYRFHSALAHTKHASAFVRWGDSNPFSSLRQYDGEKDAAITRQALLEADVIHCHVDYILMNNLGLSRGPGQILVRHYHGSVRKEDAERLGWWTHIEAVNDRIRGAKLVGARLTFYEEAERLSQEIGEPVAIEWLPITVPVERYLALPTEKPTSCPSTAFRIAHCPTKRSNKGTDVFLKVCDRLQQAGLQVIPVLMEKLPQAEALERKRTCDATFDSFWLGIQTSGLEGGAMQMPVIAGDPDVAALYREHVGYVPYTYANDERTLALVIERLMLDRAYYDAEAARVHAYVREWHDYPAVAARYESLLAKWLKRDDVFTDPLARAA
jgi:hypothetical protein